MFLQISSQEYADIQVGMGPNKLQNQTHARDSLKGQIQWLSAAAEMAGHPTASFGSNAAPTDMFSKYVSLWEFYIFEPKTWAHYAPGYIQVKCHAISREGILYSISTPFPRLAGEKRGVFADSEK